MGMIGISGIAAAGAAAVALATGGGGGHAPRSDAAPQPPPGTREVLFVANNWDGTADEIDPKTFKKLGRLNIVPDLQARLDAIYADPEALAYFALVHAAIGEGHDQYADDMFSSADGRHVYVSRPSLADVVSIDLQTNQIAWRFPMEGHRADHMAISPDGTRLLVSDSTARKVHVLDTADGHKAGEFASGDSPHESNYSRDGSKIFHASIGTVYTPGDDPVFDSAKGDRWFEIIDASTFEVLKRLDIGKLLKDNGFGTYSSAVRPMAIAPDEKTAYLQLSFLHGFVVFDLVDDKPLKVVNLPIAQKTKTLPRELYLLDSAHHGLALNPEGTKLCAAGTMSDYAAIVSTTDYSYKLISPIDKPYWSTNSGDGRYCFISASGADSVVVVDYATEKEVTRIPVGDHPQRMRMGVIRSEFVGEAPAPSSRARAKLAITRAVVRGGRLRLTLRISSRASGAVRVTFTAGGVRRTFSVKLPTRRVASASTLSFTVTRALGVRQRRARGGQVLVRFAGTTAVRAQAVRRRAVRG